MDLKCRKLDCKHNSEYACVKEGIEVKRNCVCGSYERAEDLLPEQRQDASRTMFETAPEVHPYRHNRDINIKCNANCLFNKDTNCVANGICVSETENCATCITHIEP